MRVLVVKSSFKDHKRGSVIKDQAEIDAILESEQQVHCVVANHPDEAEEPHEEITSFQEVE